MPAARCSGCNVDFEVELAGNPCPICQAFVLDPIGNIEPDDPEDVRRLVREAEFERYYEERGYREDPDHAAEVARIGVDAA